jgi:hypothetical protein
MDSNTSSDLDLNILDNDGNNMNIPPLKKETSETDLYLGLLANPAKSRVNSVKSSSSSINFNDDDKNSTSSVNNYSDKKRSDHRSDRRSERRSEHYSDHRSERRSERRNHSTESSKARYEDVPITEATPAPQLTAQQIRMIKIDLLRKLSDLKTKGYKLTKEYDFNSSIEEMQYEYELLKSFAERRAGIKLYKNTIINVTNVVEFFNSKYDPFSIQLEGWAEHMSVEVESYDDVLEELYEKYKGSGRALPAEVRLLILIAFSASAFHFSKKHMSGLGGGKSSSPFGGIQSTIAQKIASMGKEKSQFMSEQEINIERQKEEMREKEKEMKRNINRPMQVPQSMPVQQQMPIPRQPEVNLTNAHAPVNFNPQTFAPGGPPSLIIPKTTESVKDVLNRLHNRDADSVTTIEDTTANNDRLVSDTSATENSKKGKGKKKKPLMQI